MEFRNKFEKTRGIDEKKQGIKLHCAVTTLRSWYTGFMVGGEDEVTPRSIFSRLLKLAKKSKKNI